MPIAVVCPGCKVRFSVSEKYAGKKGPCPKCKVTITIPLAPAPEIKIAEPEQFASGGRDSKGRPVSKPIARKETKIRPTTWAAIVGGSLFVLVLALICRGLAYEGKLAVIVVGLLVLSPLVAVAGYNVLRNEDDLEPYSGRALWVRSLLCAAVYAGLWGLYYPLAPFLTGEVWQWFFVAPVFVGIGGAAAYALFDLDFGTGSLHYAFYLIVTLILRSALGLPPLWAVTSG